MDDRTWIKSLKPGSDLEETYVVRTRDLRQKRGGGNYLAITIGDRTGEVTALARENAEELGKVCEPGAVVLIGGQVQRYQGRTQVVVRRVEEVDPATVDAGMFVRSSAADPTVLWKKFESLIEAVEDRNLKQLLFRVFSEPEVKKAFSTAPAGKTMHHAFRAGLLEHTVSTAEAARLLADHYRLHRDLVVAGVLLHDLGKIWELGGEHSIEYTDDGRLLGHIAMEVLHVERHISELREFPTEMRRHLLHILLSHHGEYEFGSPRRPKTPEAMLVHFADNLDSRLAAMFEAIDADGESDEAWSGFSKMLARNVYRRRP